MVCEHEFGEEITKEATCEEAGKVYKVCKLCEYEDIIEETPALGHNFVSGVCTKCSGYEITCALTDVTKIENLCYSRKTE